MENTNTLIAGIPAQRLADFTAREARRFAAARPNAAKVQLTDYLGGVPLHWMTDWPMPHLPVIASAKGATITDIDGYQIDDF